MATIQLTSEDLVKQIDDDTVKVARQLIKKGIHPHLAVVLVGEKPKTIFTELKRKRALSLGIVMSVYHVPPRAKLSDLLELIEFLNKDQEIHGIIVQLPLPAKFKLNQIKQVLQAVKADKDVDGLGKGKFTKGEYTSLAKLEAAAKKDKKFLPTTAWSIIKLGQAYTVPLKSTKSIVVVGKGMLVGQPLHQMLKQLKIRHQLVDDHSKSLERAIFGADVILAGTSATKPFLDERLVREEASIIAAGQEIDHRTLDGFVKALTPKKGGVGPLTISLLLNNLVTTCKNKHA